MYRRTSQSARYFRANKLTQRLKRTLRSKHVAMGADIWTLPMSKLRSPGSRYEAEEPAYDRKQEPYAEKGLSEFIGHHPNRLPKRIFGSI